MQHRDATAEKEQKAISWRDLLFGARARIMWTITIGITIQAFGWFLVLILSVGVAIAILNLYVSTVRIGPFRSALIMNLEPLLATLLSAAWLGEVLTPLQGLGAAVMLAAIVAFQIWR